MQHFGKDKIEECSSAVWGIFLKQIRFLDNLNNLAHKWLKQF